MRCELCNGSGACDPCDGYGTYPDSSPNAGDGPDCEICDSSGECPNCHGTGIDNGTKNGDEIGADDEKHVMGVSA